MRVTPTRRIALVAATATLVAGLAQASGPAAAAPSTALVVAEAYGGGGNSGATLKNDFVELGNRGSASASLTGWSVQYISASPTR